MGWSRIEVARICKIPAARVRYWEKTSLVRASVAAGEDARFTFQDLVCVRAVLALLERGVPVRRIRRSLDGLRERVPEIDRPLGQLRIWLDDSDRVVVRHDGLLVEPSGQFVLDFPLAPPTVDDARPLPLRVNGDGDAAATSAVPETALEWFDRGCQLDDEPATIAQARVAYERALELDPALADAHCNLGTVHYNQGRREAARTCYVRALALDEDHVEAHFNLANLFEEDGRDEAALQHYKASLRVDPTYADGQLNLALLYEKLGLRRKARDHWRRYLQLEPAGPFADLARRHLAEAE